MHPVHHWVSFLAVDGGWSVFDSNLTWTGFSKIIKKELVASISIVFQNVLYLESLQDKRWQLLF